MMYLFLDLETGVLSSSHKPNAEPALGWHVDLADV